MVSYSKFEFDNHQARQRVKSGKPDVEPYDGKEKDLHDSCLAEARRRHFYVVHSRTDQRTTQQKGVPDMILAMPDGKTAWIELKVGKNKLSEEQEATGIALDALGHDFFTCRNFEEFLIAIQ